MEILFLQTILLQVILFHGTNAATCSKWLVDNNSNTAMSCAVSLPSNCRLAGWGIKLTFPAEVLDFNGHGAFSNPDCVHKTVCIVRNVAWNRDVASSVQLQANFNVKLSGRSIPNNIISEWEEGVCDVPEPPPGNGANYKSSWQHGTDGIMEAYDLQLKAPCAMTGWNLKFSFSKPLTTMEIWVARYTCREGNLVCFAQNMYATSIQKGDELSLGFHAAFNGFGRVNVYVTWADSTCGAVPSPTVSTTIATSTTAAPATTTTKTATSTAKTAASTTQTAATTTKTAATTTKTATSTQRPSTTTLIGSPPYDYGKVLNYSILFYEAQRSGRLPANNRIQWRVSAMTDDKGLNGEDLSGGWFDAGDYVKFNLPMAASATLLAWGMIEHKAAYVHAGQWENALDCVKWALDYFIKCHVGDNQVYAQVGNGQLDHAYWLRPEDMTVNRPAYKLQTDKPGSDVVGEMAAAMTAGSIIFRESDPEYADDLLSHAEALYNFAVNYKGLYHHSVSDAAKFYPSTAYKDELAWAAAWLHKATGENQYLTDADEYLTNFPYPTELSWDDKAIGANVLLYQNNPSHAGIKSRIIYFMDYWKGLPQTPTGLSWLRQWGPLRYAANAAFIHQLAAKAGIRVEEGNEFARRNIHNALGDAGRSYVVGFGHNPPVRPHHSASSCRSGEECGWSKYHSPDPNPHVLYGALVGGPGLDGSYTDVRTDYIKNEVTCDYNAGFQSAVAGLLSMHLDG